MALAGADVSPEKKTGFIYKGKEIILSKTRGAPLTGIRKQAGWHPETKKIEVATLYATTGNAEKVAELAQIPVKTVRNWTREQWFKTLLEEIRNENNELLDAKFTEIVHKAQDLVVDRLENGDFYVNRDGELHRKPVGIRDLALVSAITVDKRQIIRNKPTSITVQGQTEDQKLEKLKEFFVDLVQKGKKVEKVIENVEYQEVVAEDPAPVGSGDGGIPESQEEVEQPECPQVPTT